MSKPVRKYRLGQVSIAVFENEGKERTFESIKIQKSYKDDSGEWKNTDNLTLPHDAYALRTLIDRMLSDKIATENNNEAKPKTSTNADKDTEEERPF